MKKLILAVAFLFFAGFTHAATLKGAITDPINNIANLNLVEVTLNEDSENSVISNDEDKGFKFTDFDPFGATISMPSGTQKITFSKEGYVPQTGTITLKKSALFYNDVFFSGIKQRIDPTTHLGEPDPNATYTLPEIKLLPNPDVIISGKITAVRGEDEVEQQLVWGKVKIFASENGKSLKVVRETEGEYSVKGYLGTKENPRYITVVFKYAGYKDIEETFMIKAGIKDKENIKFKEKTIAGQRQENLEAITGFGCNEIMPKYLVGANCVENSDLEGDATDIAVWIQKFGGKITGMISMIAVVLIVWNAFALVTAVGDTEKISQAKKGIMWTIIGLAVTMFAYVLVKTVIILTYTQ